MLPPPLLLLLLFLVLLMLLVLLLLVFLPLSLLLLPSIRGALNEPEGGAGDSARAGRLPLPRMMVVGGDRK